MARLERKKPKCLFGGCHNKETFDGLCLEHHLWWLQAWRDANGRNNGRGIKDTVTTIK